MTSTLRWGWVVSATPRPLYPRERIGTHCTGCWVDPRAGLDGCGKSRPPPEFDPRTVQPVASRYTDWAIPAHCSRIIKLKEENVVQHHHARTMNPSLLIHILQQLWMDVSQEIVVNDFQLHALEAGEDPRSLSHAVSAWRLQVNTFEIFFNIPEQPVIREPSFTRPTFINVFSCTVVQISLL